jgi:glycosyltransferase involved in cell wall biosynthesis
MNILFISSYYLSDETRFGGSKRLYLLAKGLKKYADVSVICLDGCREYGGRDALSGTHPDFEHFLYLPWTDSRGLFGKIAVPGIIIEDLLKKNRTAIRSFLGTRTYHAALIAFPLGLSFIGTVIPTGQFPIVYLEDDLFLEKVRTDRQKGLFDRIYRAVRMNQLLSFYRRKLAFCDTFIAISSQEKEIINRYFPAVKVLLLGYGVDLDRYPFRTTMPGAFTLGFIGNFRHMPNVDALDWFLTQVYPFMKKEIPGIRMSIAGPEVPDRLLSGNRPDDSISWLGDVADLGIFYGAISVFVNPIVSGRGMRTKLIEVAAFGRPIVSTALGAEGMESLSIDIAETARDFAGCCRRLQEDRSRYMSAAANNRNVVERNYTIEKVCKGLVDILSVKTGQR